MHPASDLDAVLGFSGLNSIPGTDVRCKWNTSRFIQSRPPRLFFNLMIFESSESNIFTDSEFKFLTFMQIVVILYENSASCAQCFGNRRNKGSLSLILFLTFLLTFQKKNSFVNRI